MSAFTGMQFTEAEEPALQAIEADIEHHSKLLVGLRRRRNSFVRLNRLPPELLAEIFLYCRGEVWDLPNNLETAKCRATPPRLRWIFVTAVCRHLNSGRTLTFSTLNSQHTPYNSPSNPRCV